MSYPNPDRPLLAEPRASASLDWSLAISQYGMCLALLTSFTLAVSVEESYLAEVFSRAKWLVFLGFFFLTCLGASTIYVRPLGFVSACFLVFVILATFSSLTGPGNFNEGLQRSLSFWFLYFLAFVLVMPVDPDRRIEVWTKSLVAICAVVVVGSAAYILSGNAYEQGRLRGLTENANTLGGFSAVVIVAAYAIWFTRGKRRGSWMAIGTVAVICLLLAQSRGGLIGTVAGVTAVSATRKTWLLLGVALAAAGLMLMSEAQGDRVRLGTLGGAEFVIRKVDLQNRDDILLDHYYKWREKPLVGHGLQIGDKDGTSRAQRSAGQASYTDLLVATGALGALPFFVGLAVGLRALLAYCSSGVAGNRETPASPYAMAALGITTAILVHSAAEGYMAAVGAVQPIYVWVTIGAAVQLARPTQRSVARQPACDA